MIVIRAGSGFTCSRPFSYQETLPGQESLQPRQSADSRRIQRGNRIRKSMPQVQIIFAHVSALFKINSMAIATDRLKLVIGLWGNCPPVSCSMLPCFWPSRRRSGLRRGVARSRMRTEAGKMPESLISPIRNGHGVSNSSNDRFGLKGLQIFQAFFIFSGKLSD